MSLFFLAVLASSMVQEVAGAPRSASASQTESSSGDAASEHEDSEIVVSGERGDEIDAANRLPKVIVGSRIPRASFQNNPHIASATSLGGLTPGSGIDAFKSDATVKWKSCKVAGFAVSSDVGCALQKAGKAIEAQQWSAARTILADLATNLEVSLEGQYLAHRLSYQIAANSGDREGRRHSLAGMVGTGLMGAAEEPGALRTLASMATSAGDTEEAIARYREVIALDAGDYRSRVNLGALLQRNQDEEGARTQFRAAIAIMQRSGLAVPDDVLQAAR